MVVFQALGLSPALETRHSGKASYPGFFKHSGNTRGGVQMGAISGKRAKRSRREAFFFFLGGGRDCGMCVAGLPLVEFTRFLVAPPLAFFNG